MWRYLVLALVAAASLACGSSAWLRGADDAPYHPSGSELCGYRTFFFALVQSEGTVSPQWARDRFASAIAAATGLQAVDEQGDLAVYVWITDATECLHCPQDHNYWAWSITIHERATTRFIVALHGSGNKLWTSPVKATAQQLSRLRRCGTGFFLPT